MCEYGSPLGEGRGEGPPAAPILLLHGFGGDGQSWASLTPHLARTGRAVSAPDLRGDSLAALAEAATAQLDATPGAVELVGHSLGGAVATLVARARPPRVARLTLIAPAGLGSEIDADFVHGLAQVRSGAGLAHLLRRLVVRPPLLSPAEHDRMAAALQAARLGPLAGALVAGGGRQQIDILPDLAALPMPVRIVWGLQDRIVPWQQATRAGSRIALHLIDGAGHVPHWDRPEEVAALFA